MVSNNEGLTSTYNRFHDPAETSTGILELRRLHGEMDQAVLNAYGWSDVPTACGFGLDYLDLDDDGQLPEELQERIDSGDLFFWAADEALDFQGQLQAYGAITAARKLPWRYRWPDAVRDDVLPGCWHSMPSGMRRRWRWGCTAREQPRRPRPGGKARPKPHQPRNSSSPVSPTKAA